MKVKLAEALLRRKELQQKIATLGPINQNGLFEVRVKRVPAAEGIDDVTAAVPKITMQQVTACHDWHAKALRLVDAMIQQTNWTAEVDLPDFVMDSYVDPYVKGQG